jgi:hypothetical protein
VRPVLKIEGEVWEEKVAGRPNRFVVLTEGVGLVTSTIPDG